MNTFIDLIESLKSRGKTALVYHNGFRTFHYSYKDLYSLVRRAASLYRESGIVKGDRIALWGANQPEWVVAYLGAIYAGAVVVPIDLQSHPDAAEKIIAHAGVKLIVKSRSRSSFLKGIKNLILEDLEYDLKSQEKFSPAIAKPNDLAEIVYTSGTTGEPKGVMLTNENILTNVASIKKHIKLSTEDSVLSLLPLSHMLEQTSGLLVPLASGMTIVYTHALTPTSIFRALRRQRITIMIVVPRILQGMRLSISSRLQVSSFGKALASLAQKTDGMPRLVKKILFFPIHTRFGAEFRLFVSGGAYLDENTEQYWNRLGFTLLQGYGLTECSPVLTATEEGKTKIGSVGCALSGVEVRLSDTGEILAKGKNIFHGYFNDPEKTKATFRQGWFITGDIGTFDETGDLFIKGRQKDVIVTGAGKNVYPDDIETILNGCPGVKESCVVGIVGELGEEVVATIVPTDAGVSLSNILKAANEKLDSSQRIQSVSIWSETELPKTTTLKVKRSLVKEVLEQKQDKQQVNEPPIAHDKLQWLVAEVTGKPIEEVRATSILYRDLKLDSIGRVELVALVSREFNFDLEEELITGETTVSDLQGIIDRRATGDAKWKHPRWPHFKFMRIVRFLGMELANANIARLFCRLQVRGRENLKDLHGPVIFAANHVSYGDHTNIFRALPFRYRYMIASPALAEFFLLPPNAPVWAKVWKKFSYYWSAATMALFLMTSTHSQKKSLEQAGMLVDQGESILIFPEGKRTFNHEMLPFMKGTAVLAKNLRIPIVPIGHRGLEYIFPRGAAIPKFGRVVLTFGKPFFVEKQSIEDATNHLKDEIERLRKA